MGIIKYLGDMVKSDAAKNLGDIATADIFDFNNTAKDLKIAPLTNGYTPDYSPTNYNADTFNKAYSSNTIGDLKNAATKDPNGFNKWLGDMGEEGQLKIGSLMDKQGWNTPDVIDMNSSNNNYLQAEKLDLQKKMYNNVIDQQNKLNDSWGYRNKDTIKGASQVVSTATSLADIYVGMQQLGVARDTLKIEKDKWNATNDEIDRIKGVRKNLTNNYMS